MIELHLSEVAPALNAVVLGHDVRFKGCSIDSRNVLAGSLFIALRGQRFDSHDFISAAQQHGAVALMIDRPVACSIPTLRVEDTRKALGKLAHFWRQRFQLPLVAITGSNGKTTTKEMLKTILARSVLASRGNFNNEIGVPLTLFELNHQHHYAIIEMGANHAGEIDTLSQMAQPTVATITQCAPAHLEGFKNIDGVALAKGEIFTHLHAQGTAVINNDDVYAELWSKHIEHTHAEKNYTLSRFAITHAAEIKATQINLQPYSSSFNLNTPQGSIAIQLPLLGKHNIMNALAASACALACGCNLEQIQQGLEQIQPVAGRLQHCAGIEKSTLLDDSYNANPASLNAALTALTQHAKPHWLILGDMNELGTRSVTFHRQAGRLAREMGVERLWALGVMSRYAVESFGSGAEHFAHHDDLLQALRAQFVAGATLLIKGSRSMQMEKIVRALREEG